MGRLTVELVEGGTMLGAMRRRVSGEQQRHFPTLLPNNCGEPASQLLPKYSLSKNTAETLPIQFCWVLQNRLLTHILRETVPRSKFRH